MASDASSRTVKFYIGLKRYVVALPAHGCFGGKWFYIGLKPGLQVAARVRRFRSKWLYIGLKLIEVKARISAMSGGISFYMGLKRKKPT